MWWKTKFRYNPENGGYTKKNFGYSTLSEIGLAVALKIDLKREE